MTNLLIPASYLGHSRRTKNEPFIRNTRYKDTNSNHTLHYLQNILPYIIIECKMHYASLKKLLNLRHCQITIIDSLI